MNESFARVIRQFSKRRALISMAIVAALVSTSAVAVTALSSSNSKTILTIQSVSANPEEAYVCQAVEWMVVVEVQDRGQQGKGILFTWDWDDGNYTVHELKSLGGNSTAIDVQSHFWTEPGLYEVVISIWDGYGSEQNAFHNVSSSVPFTVKPAEVNTPPVAAFDVEPEQGTIDTVFSFDASPSWDHEDETDDLEVRWDWQSDGIWDTPYNLTKTAEHQFSEVGVHVVTLEVVDQGGLVNMTSQEVTVISSPALLPHDPIVIIGDDDFIPANGVIGGVGTCDDPYVIGGWDILPIEGSGITVMYTTKYFTIIDSRIRGDIDFCIYGVHLEDVEHAVLRDLNVSGFYMGVFAKLTDDLTVAECQITWSSWGIFALRCGSIYITENEVAHNIVGMGNHEGIMVQETDYALIALNNLVDNWDGIALYIVTEGLIYNNTMLENAIGIQALYAGCLVFGNFISSIHCGMILGSCPDTIVETNTIVVNPLVSDPFFGIEFISCTNLDLTCNIIDSYRYGIGTNYGYSDHPYSENVTVSWNKITNCSDSGMRLYYVAGMTVAANAFLSNGIGVDIDASASGIHVHHNDFLDNSVQAVEDLACVGNEWDDGYPSGGNYWSDYQGVDEFSGVDQTEPGSDGIGDAPYVLASGSQDNYPLMESYTPTPSNTAPVASFTVDPPTAPAGILLCFDATSSWDAQDPVESLMIRWDWEWDGIWDTSYSCNKTAEHAYDVPGVYTIALEVIDSGGLTGFALRNVSVLESPAPVPHAPIAITSDDEFTAENGVVGGSGLPDDPYVISGWRITATDCNCISIANTSAYFVIHDIDFRADSFEVYAMYLGNVCNGYILNSDTSRSVNGFMIESCSFINVIGCHFAGNVYGVQIDSSSNFNLRACDFTDCLQAFEAQGSYAFSLVSCILKADIPCWLGGCAQGVLEGNYMECLGEMRIGAYVTWSGGMTFSDNRFVDCSIDITGWWAPNFNTHTISADNTVNGKPILHYQGLNNLVLDNADAGEVILVECQNVTMSNMTFTRGYAAVILAYSSDAVIENNAFSSCWIGARVCGCRDVVLRGNTVDMVVQQGIGIWDTVGVVVENNLVSSNGIFGYQTLMPIYGSSNVSLSDNTLADSWEGMFIFSTTGIEVSGNQVSGMITRGVFIGYCSGIHVTENEFAMNEIGLRLEECTRASVYHNNFLDNTVQAENIGGVDILWDGGYPDGGNYWSDYIGEDLFGGPDQNIPGSDGIGDTPYVASVIDYYPLMTPYV